MNYDSTVSHKDNVITFVINSNKTILDDEISLYNDDDEINLGVVNNLVTEFNRISNGLILDYNYTVIDKQNINLEILFKHVFNKFGEVQRYINYSIVFDKDTKTLEISLKKKNIGLKNINKCQQFPFSRIQITNTKINNLNKTVITAYADNDIYTYKNHKMIIDFVRRSIYDNYLNIDNYIQISKR